MINDIKKLLASKLIVTERHNDETIEEFRKNTCYSCEHYDKDNDKCKVCKCIIDVKSKALKNRTKRGTIELTHCPEGKWGDREVADYYKPKNKS